MKKKYCDCKKPTGINTQVGYPCTKCGYPIMPKEFRPTPPVNESWEKFNENKKTMREFGESIFLYRRRRNIKSIEFAKTHGISRATLWRIERGFSDSIPVSMHLELLSTARQEEQKEFLYQLRHLTNYDNVYAAVIGNVVPVDKITKLIDSLTSKGGTNG